MATGEVPAEQVAYVCDPTRDVHVAPCGGRQREDDERATPAVGEDLPEKSVTALAAELTSVTGLPPEITCTAPVLDQASKL